MTWQSWEEEGIKFPLWNPPLPPFFRGSFFVPVLLPDNKCRWKNRERRFLSYLFFSLSRRNEKRNTLVQLFSYLVAGFIREGPGRDLRNADVHIFHLRNCDNCIFFCFGGGGCLYIYPREEGFKRLSSKAWRSSSRSSFKKSHSWPPLLPPLLLLLFCKKKNVKESPFIPNFFSLFHEVKGTLLPSSSLFSGAQQKIEIFLRKFFLWARNIFLARKKVFFSFEKKEERV